MISDKTALFNLALSEVGSRELISQPNEKSRSAEICRLWYPVVRDQVLQAAFWHSNRKTEMPTIVAERDENAWTVGQPEPGWQYSCVVPDDLLRPRFLSDYAPFNMTTSGGQRRLQTNVPVPILTYSCRSDDISTWETGLQMAVMQGLAAMICMPLTGKVARQQQCLESANSSIVSARASTANDQNEMFETLPDWIIARGYNNPQSVRFYYPMGSLLTVI